MVNKTPAIAHRPPPHRIDRDIPYQDTRAPNGFTNLLLRSVSIDMQVATGQRGILREDSGLGSSPLLICSSPPAPASSPMLMVCGNTVTESAIDGDLEEVKDMMELRGSEHSLLSLSQDYPSSPLLLGCVSPSMGMEDKRTADSCATDEDLQKLAKCVTQLIDLTLRSSIGPNPCKASKQFTLYSSNESQALSLIAPSIFLLGYAEAIAAQAPLISRMATSLANITERSASEHESLLMPQIVGQLWCRLDHELRERYAGKKLRIVKYATSREHDASSLIDIDESASSPGAVDVGLQPDLLSISDEDWMLSDGSCSDSDGASMQDCLSDSMSMLDDDDSHYDLSQSGAGLHCW